MQTNFKEYNFDNSLDRIDDILAASDTSFTEINEIPARDKLTFKNGYYVNCSALFVDIRESSKLPSKHKRPTLAKIYRSYISEIVAIMNGNPDCSEIRIDGDCISGIYNTPQKLQIDGMFSDAARISSLIDILNYKFKKKNISEIDIGIGIDYGRALMIKSGYSGSTLNEVVWMGDVVNVASNLCNHANKGFSSETLVSSAIYNNLNNKNQALLTWNSVHQCYQGNVVNLAMNKWLNDKIKASQNSYRTAW